MTPAPKPPVQVEVVNPAAATIPVVVANPSVTHPDVVRAARLLRRTLVVAWTLFGLWAAANLAIAAADYLDRDRARQQRRIENEAFFQGLHGR